MKEDNKPFFSENTDINKSILKSNDLNETVLYEAFPRLRLVKEFEEYLKRAEGFKDYLLKTYGEMTIQFPCLDLSIYEQDGLAIRAESMNISLIKWNLTKEDLTHEEVKEIQRSIDYLNDSLDKREKAYIRLIKKQE